MTAVKLVVADVDGTLLTSEKKITPATVAAVAKLREAGIRFAVASARPPLGLVDVIKQLDVDTPVAAFDGGLIVTPRPGLRVIRELRLDDWAVRPVMEQIERAGLETWAYCGSYWYASDRHSDRVAEEYRHVRFSPSPRGDLHTLTGVAKIAGIGDPDAVAGAHEAVQRMPVPVSASRSQPFELDVTHRQANKGGVVEWLCKRYGLRYTEIAAIGDGEVDTAMFAKADISIAMGNAPDSVKEHAWRVTSANYDEGFACAMERFVLS